MSGPWRVCHTESPVNRVATPAVGTVGPPSSSAEVWNVRSSSAMSDRLNGARRAAMGR